MKQARTTTKPGQITPEYAVHAIPRNFKRRTLCDPGVVAAEIQLTDEPVDCLFCLETARDIAVVA